MDLFPRSLVSVTIDRLKSAFSGANAIALLSLVCFIACNALKLSAFDLLIVSNGYYPNFHSILQHAPGKLIIASACAVILLRFPWRFPIILFYVLQTLYICVNVLYYFAFLGYLHISQYIGLSSESFELLTHASVPWDAHWFAVLFDLPLLVMVAISYKRLQRMDRELLFKPVLYGAGIFMVLSLYHWEVPVESPMKIMNNRYVGDASVVHNYGLLTFNCLDLFNYQSDRTLVHSINYGPEITYAGSDSCRRNILIIQVESLDANVINYRHNGKYAVPFLHSLSESSIYYPYCLSYHLAGSTSDCEFSTINSIEPFQSYPSMKIRNYDYPNSVLKRFSANGYSVTAFHGNHAIYFNRGYSYKRMGFQKFYDEEEMRLPECGWGIPDSAVFNFAKTKLFTMPAPYLCYIVTMSSHEPFTLIKDRWHNRLFNDVRNGVSRNYLNSISYVDASLRGFISWVRKNSPNTVIFIYGDHTPTLPKNSYNKAAKLTPAGYFEFVPLIIITPDSATYREKTYAASFLDIAPTVLAASGCPASIKTIGRNLLEFPSRDRDVPFCNGIYSRKYLYSLIGGRR